MNVISLVAHVVCLSFARALPVNQERPLRLSPAA